MRFEQGCRLQEVFKSFLIQLDPFRSDCSQGPAVRLQVSLCLTGLPLMLGSPAFFTVSLFAFSTFVSAIRLVSLTGRRTCLVHMEEAPSHSTQLNSLIRPTSPIL